MYRTMAAQPDLFCAYYEPMIATTAGKPLGRIGHAARKSAYSVVAAAFRSCLALVS